MPWPFWASDSSKDNRNDNTSTRKGIHSEVVEAASNTADLNSADPARFSTTQTVAACITTTAATFVLVQGYKRYLRRIPNVSHLKPSHLRNRSLYGYVTSVGDGDNFRLFHTPGGRLAGWGVLPWRQTHVSGNKKKLQDNTLHIRLAGVDAPECAHFGRPAQPYSQEALDWLRGQTLGRYVRVWPWRKDQYGRVVCTVYSPKWLFFKSDVSLEMLKNGWATVYEAKFGSEFGDKEDQYRAAAERAKERKVGMWQQPGLVAKMLGRKGSDELESPRDYKNRMKKEEMGM